MFTLLVEPFCLFAIRDRHFKSNTQKLVLDDSDKENDSSYRLRARWGEAQDVQVGLGNVIGSVRTICSHPLRKKETIFS